MIKRSEDLKTPFILISILFFICLMPLISSQTYDLKIATNSTACNVTVTYPNSTNIIINKVMTSGIGYYNYSLDIPQGEYKYFSPCGSGTFNTNGENLSTGTSLIYFLVTLFAFFIFIGIGWIFLNINGDNPRDETGYLGITYRKYIKTALFPLVYVCFIWFFNFIIGLSNNYLGLTLYTNTLGFIFMILTKLILPVVIITFIIEIVLMIKDANIEKEYKSLWSQF